LESWSDAKANYRGYLIIQDASDILYRVPSTEYRVPSTEYRVPSTEYRVPSTEKCFARHGMSKVS